MGEYITCDMNKKQILSGSQFPNYFDRLGFVGENLIGFLSLNFEKIDEMRKIRASEANEALEKILRILEKNISGK